MDNIQENAVELVDFKGYARRSMANNNMNDKVYSKNMLWFKLIIGIILIFIFQIAFIGMIIGFL
jgi:hypothetical protein